MKMHSFGQKKNMHYKKSFFSKIEPNYQEDSMSKMIFSLCKSHCEL